MPRTTKLRNGKMVVAVNLRLRTETDEAYAKFVKSPKNVANKSKHKLMQDVLEEHKP